MHPSIQTKQWPYTFAPKRKTWHADFFAPKLDHANVVLGVFNVSLVLFVAVAVTTQVPRLTSVQLAPMPQVASVAGSAAVINAMLPAQPVATLPYSVAYENDLHTAKEFAVYFTQSLPQTVASAWQNSFGFAGTVYVASVYEFLNNAGVAMQTDFNTANVWDAWTDMLALNLYSPNAPAQLLAQ